LPTDPKELKKVLDRAQRGDETARPALRKLLNKPHLAEARGNLAAHAQHSWSAYSRGRTWPSGRRCRAMKSLRAELAGATPTPLESLPVEHIVSCWLHLYHLETICAGKESMSLDLGSYYQRSITSAHQRYLSAIKALAVVRKSALPALQVNIAHQQVNVAGKFPATDTGRSSP
jgi:hypothetical protein